ncbi:MAG TPA: hypothetical protein VF175_06945, partial [Lacipirellula sp.]
MSTTFDPTKEAALQILAKPASTNGKPETSLSQLASRNAFWCKPAPKPLRKERLAADEALTLFWNERTPRASLAELCAAEGTPLEWGKLSRSLSAATQALVDLLTKAHVEDSADEKSRKKAKREAQAALTTWLEAAAAATPSYDLGMGCLATASLLHEFGELLSPSLTWRSLELLWNTARHATAWNLGADAAPEDVVASQLLGVELPLTLAYLFAEMAPMARLAHAASDFL